MSAWCSTNLCFMGCLNFTRHKGMWSFLLFVDKGEESHTEQDNFSCHMNILLLPDKGTC